MTTTRSFSKCQRCRDDHKKCIPYDRDWNHLKQKCSRCDKRSYDCGPSVCLPTTRNRKKRQNNNQNHTHRSAIPRLQIQDTISRSQIASPNLESPTQATFADIGQIRSMSSWWNDLGWGITETLEAILVTQRLLQSACNTIYIFAQRKGLPNHPTRLRDAIGYAQQCLDLEFQRIAETQTTARVESCNVGSDLLTRQNLCQLRNLYHFVHTMSAKQPLDGETLASIAELDGNTWMNLDSRVLSSVSHVNVMPSEYPSTPKSPWTMTTSRHCKTYENAHRVVNDVLSKAPFRCFEARSVPMSQDEIQYVRDALIQGFPASHIAFLNKDPAAAFKLWGQADPQNQPQDILSRTLAHLGVTFNSLDTLKNIATRLQEKIADMAEDAFGLSPQDTAVFLDDLHSFNLLHWRQAERRITPHVQEFAIKADSSTIVSFILDLKEISPPYGQLVKQAIEHQSNKVIELFVPYLQMREYHSQVEVLENSALARTHGLHDLAAELQDVQPTFPTQQQILTSIGEAERRPRTIFLPPYRPEYPENWSEETDSHGASYSREGYLWPQS